MNTDMPAEDFSHVLPEDPPPRFPVCRPFQNQVFDLAIANARSRHNAAMRQQLQQAYTQARDRFKHLTPEG